MEVTRRYRVNVSTTAKGQKTFDCTVELTGSDMALTHDEARKQALAESDALVAELDKRYPAPKE